MSFSLRLSVFGPVALLLFAIATQRAWGMGQEAFGPAGKHIGRSSDWPKGVETILRNQSRVYWWWVNGNEHAFYDCDMAKMNSLLDQFSKIDLQAHRIVVRPGRGSAKSFKGLVVDHNAEFELPGGIFFHHAQELGATGLYCATPRLIIYIDTELGKQLDDLIVPANCTLQSAPYRMENVLAHTGSNDSSLRWRAISLLGEMGVSSDAVSEALQKAANEGNENLQKTARQSLSKIEKSNSPESRPLRQQVAGFLLNHPQRLRTPRPDELLAALRANDAQYAKGFTAKGTMVVPQLSGFDQLVEWTVTMGDQKLVIRQRAATDSSRPQKEGLLEKIYFISPEQMGTIHRSRLWVENELLDTKPHATFEPVGPTYDLLIGRILWPLGRNFTRRIDKVLEVSPTANGNLAVKAEGAAHNLPWRWELRIDPDSDYLVRSAKAYLRDDEVASYAIDSLGVVSAKRRSTTHTARWSEGERSQPISTSVQFVSDKPDNELIQQTEEELATLKAEGR